MAVDYQGALDMMLPVNYSFGTINPQAIVLHSTGGDLTLDAVHNTFLQSMRSTHFAIDRNGAIAQFVPLNRGAGGNCCPDASHNSYWDSLIPTYPNLNLCTISIEHCNDDNQSLIMTPSQMNASKKLVLWLCQKYNIPSTSIKGHDSIDATNCPGKVFYSTYWQGMLDYVNQAVGTDKRTRFNQEWSSGGIYKSDTGIANAAYQDYLTPNFHGCPVSQEYPMGNAIAQRVQMGIWFWQNGQAKYYPYH